MEAGRKLDALVAEKVMGWMKVEHFPDDDHGPYSDCVNGQRPDGAYTTVPFYSVDIAAAWQVVERLKEQCIFLDVNTAADCYNVVYDNGHGVVQEDTAPLAICLAALAAPGHPVDGTAHAHQE